MTASTGSPDQSHHTARFLRGFSGESISAENGEPKRLEERGEDMMKKDGDVDGREVFMMGGREKAEAGRKVCFDGGEESALRQRRQKQR